MVLAEDRGYFKFCYERRVNTLCIITFFSNVIYQHVVALSDVFNEMSIINYDKDGKAIGWKPVPLTLAPKEKVIAELQADPSSPDSTPPNFLPRMSLIWNGISRNQERQRGKYEKRRILVEYMEDPETGEQEEAAIRDVQTVPYDLTFELTVWTKYMTDMAQILENILPFFNPEAHVSLYERGIGSERKVKVTLESTSPNFVTDISEPERRILQCNLQFRMECNFYTPQLPISKMIKRVTTRMGIDSTKNGASEPTVEGETVNTFLLESVTGCNSFLDMDPKIWGCVVSFDDIESDYMGWEHHNDLDPQNKVPPTPSTIVNPNEIVYPNPPGYLYNIPNDDLTRGQQCAVDPEKIPFKLIIDTEITEAISQTNQFILTLDGTTDVSGNPDYLYNFNINWGDETEETVTNFTDNFVRESPTSSRARVTHTYSVPGVYIISITPNGEEGFPTLRFNDLSVQSGPIVTDARKVLFLQQWGTGIWKTMYGAFAGCANMKIIAPDSGTARTENVTDWDRAFAFCRSMTHFPGNLRMGSGEIFTSCWNGCRELKEIPKTLDFSKGRQFSYAWNGCRAVTEFPNTFDFSNSESFQGAWGGMYIESFPLINLGPATTYTAAWQSCIYLKSFPSLDLSNATRVDNAWWDCESLTEFPLVNTENVTNFNRAWNGCFRLTKMAPLNLSKLTTGNGSFWGCSALVDHPDYIMPTTSSSINFGNLFRQSGISRPEYDNFLIRLEAVNPLNKGSISQTPAKYTAGPASIARSKLASRGWSIADGGLESGFRITINTNNAGSPSDQFILPLDPLSTYNFSILWGDNTGEFITNTTTGFPNISHTYTTPGIYTITITEMEVGGFPTIYFNNSGDRLKITGITQWGINEWMSLNSSFYGCSNLNITATDFSTAKFSMVSNAESAFRDCTSLVTLNSYNWNQITNLQNAFSGCTSLTTVGASLNLSMAQNLMAMFNGATSLVTFPVISLPSMTNGANMFNGVTLSTTSYSNLLISLDSVNNNTGVTFHGGNSLYNVGSAASRNNLTSVKLWDITDGGPA